MYTDLEYWLLDECYGDGMEVVWDTGIAKEVMGSKYSYEFYDGFVTYTLTAWPDASSGGSYVTEIRITDPTVTVYGLDVMSSKSEFKETMEELGYTVHTRENDRQVAMRDDYTIMLTREGIPELYLSAAVTDRNGSF